MALLTVEGVRSTTLDRIARAAGITKRTLYYYFRSKDDLLAECLAQEAVKDRAEMLRTKERSANVAKLVERLFSSIAESARDPRWKGCAFARATFELAGLPGHPVVKAAKDHKAKIEAILTSALRAAGAVDAEKYARWLILLYDGAISQSVLRHDPSCGAEAGHLALYIVQLALEGVPMETSSWVPRSSPHEPVSNCHWRLRYA